MKAFIQRKFLLPLSLTLFFVLLIFCGYFFFWPISKDTLKIYDSTTGKLALSETKEFLESSLLGKILVRENLGYYTNGQLRYRIVTLKGRFIKIESYARDGKIISSFNNGNGQILIPNDKGEFSKENTFEPLGLANCYCYNGDLVSKEDYIRLSRKWKKISKSIVEGGLNQ